MDQNRKLLAVVKTRKLKYFGHISRHASLESDIMLRTMPGLRRQGGQSKQWIDDLREWSKNSIPHLVRKAQDRSAYQRFVYKVSSPGATGRLWEAKPPQCVTQASPDSEACNKNLTDSVDVSCHI